MKDETGGNYRGIGLCPFQKFNLLNTISDPLVLIIPVLRYGPLRYALPSLRALPYSGIRSLRVSRAQRGCIEERATQDPTQDRRNFPAPFKPLWTKAVQDSRKGKVGGEILTGTPLFTRPAARVASR